MAPSPDGEVAVSRPLLAFSLGDPSGVGPEILLRLLAEGHLPARLLVIGDEEVLARARTWVPRAPLPAPVADPRDARGRTHDAVLWAPEAPRDPLPAVGTVDERSGAASHAWVLAGARLAREGLVDALVTGPIHKEAWRRAGVPQPGHTEALRDEAGVDRVLMLLVGGRLRVALATIHVPLHQVPALLTTAGLVADLVLLHRELGRVFGPARPRIAVCGLNPHAGEGGLFGREEADVVEPAVAAARGRGIDAHGPLPADACIPAAAGGAWDGVLAMYHDQALPAVKALAWRRAVNVTLGLPYLRTSVDHGTAFDLAGRGEATPSSLREAVRLAAEAAWRARGKGTDAAGALNDGGAPSDLVG